MRTLANRGRNKAEFGLFRTIRNAGRKVKETLKSAKRFAEQKISEAEKTSIGNAVLHPAQAVKATTHYIKRKLFNNDEDAAEVIDLSKSKMSRINPTTTNAKSILFNDFVETSNDGVRTPQQWRDSAGQTFGDSHIPVNNIKYYYGLENGKIKAGDLSSFDENTEVSPIRNPGATRITEFLLNDRYKDSDAKIDSLRKVRDAEAEEWYKQQNESWDTPKLSFVDRLKGIFSKDSEEKRRFQKFVNDNPDIYPDSAARLSAMTPASSAQYELDMLEHPLRFVTERGDTINTVNLPQGVMDKALFTNENGNATFIRGLGKLNQQQVGEINKRIKNNPVYPVLVDGGRYQDYYTSVDDDHNYNTYTNQGLYTNPEDIRVYGQVYKYGGRMLSSRGKHDYL